MTNSLPAVIDNETGLIIDENTEQTAADQAAEKVFGDQENAEKTCNLVASFVDSYSRNKNSQSEEEWLNHEFSKYPDIWRSDTERQQTASIIIATIQNNNEAKADLYAHLGKGKSREAWLAKKIEQGAASSGVINVGNYAQGIDEALAKANEAMFKTVITKDYAINSSPQLHGFIAEANLANQFNINAVAAGSSLTAELPSVNTLNSPDILIKDAAGNVVEHIQVKVYAPNQEGLNNLIQNIKNHDYSNTTLVVNKEHVATLREQFPDLKITCEIEVGGVKTEILDHAEYKKQQEKLQQEMELKEYEWNDVNRMVVTKQIVKKALITAAFSAGFQGARILGRRLWNHLRGKENRPANEDLQEFFNASLESAKNAGIQVAVSGAIVVAAKNGWIKILQNTPAGRIADMVYVGLQNAKCLYKLAKGELSALEALDAMGNSTCTAVGGLAGAANGGAVGAVIGTVLGPVGTAVGGVIGGVVGGIAGSAFGEAVYQGGKTIVKTAAKALESAWEGTKEVAKNMLNTITLNLFS